MPTVGQLSVELDAKTQKFRREMTSAEKKVGDFERKVDKDTDEAASAFKGLVGPIGAVAAALVALGAIRFAKQITEGAIESAAAFESYEIRLRALLGSQQSANLALESFVELSSRTPFAVAQIVEGAATLASVADGSRQELDELVKTTANLAAVTGIPFNEAASNLQRSLAAGISAADKFREAGVRKLIEDINGIPNFTKKSLEEQRQIFKDTFGPEALTPFANAAEDLSLTMGGALSNIGDAAANAQRELGEALSPATFATAKVVIIPFFNEIEDAIVNNQDAITKFTIDGIRKMILGFASALDVGADTLIFFHRFNVELGDFPKVLSSVLSAFSLFFKFVKTGVAFITDQLAKYTLGFVSLGNAVGLVDDETLEFFREVERFTEEDLINKAFEVEQEAAKTLADISVELDKAAESGKSFADELKQGAADARKLAAEVVTVGDEFVAAARKRKAAEDEARGGRRVTGIDPEVEAALAGFDEGTAFAILQEEQLQKAATKEREKAAKAAKEQNEEIAADLASNLTSALGEGLALVLEGEAVSFAEGLAELSGELLEASLDNALKSLQEGLQKTFERLDLGGLFGGEGGARGLGQALGGALGIAGSVLARELGGTQATTRGGLVESVVTSTQELRGIVAGDVNVPIAEVAGALRDMNVETVAEQRTTNSLLREIRDRQAEGGGGIDSSSDLVTAIGDEFNGTPALG